MSVALRPAADTDDRCIQKPIAPDFSRPAFCLQGLLCDVLTIEEAKEKVIASIKGGRRCNLVTPNTNVLRLVRSDTEVRDAVLASDLAVIDGMPLVWCARALGIPVPHRVCGSDLFDALMGHTAERFGAFFFGATDDVGRRVRKRLDESTSGLRCAGVYSPGFGSIESMTSPGILDAINRAGSDLLIVSIGARKGLLWLMRNEPLISAPVICNLGATINFVAGSVKRAPAFLRRHGLEWLWRIKEEPALCMRYALDLATLIAVLVAQILPCLLECAIYRLSARRLSPPRVQLYHDRAAEILTFSGVWTKDNLAPVRAALTTATRRTTNLVIDLEDVAFVDAAFLGQILLAYGYQRRTQRGFVLRASRRPIRKLLRLHGCANLLKSDRTGSGADLAASGSCTTDSEISAAAGSGP